MDACLKEKWFNIAEGVECLGVNKNSIRNWIKNDSGIPLIKLGDSGILNYLI